MAGNDDALSVAFTDACCNGADADFTHQFDRDVGFGVAVFQVENQLCKIFNRVDVMMRRRRNQGDAGDAEA